MKVYIVMRYVDYEGGELFTDEQDRVQGYASREAAIQAEVPKSSQKSLTDMWGGWDVYEVILPTSKELLGDGLNDFND